MTAETVAVIAAVVSAVCASIAILINYWGIRQRRFLERHRKELEEMDQLIELFSTACTKWLIIGGGNGDRATLREIERKFFVLDASPLMADDLNKWKRDPCIDLLISQNILGEWIPGNFESLELKSFHPSETTEDYLKRKIRDLNNIKHKALNGGSFFSFVRSAF